MLKNRFKTLFYLISFFILVAFFVRVGLLIFSFLEVEGSSLLKVFLIGFFYDLIASFYFFIPFVFFLIFVSSKFLRSKVGKAVILFFIFLQVYIILFSGVAEFFFWDEFGKRFNFIAVDYLIYTHEVVKNIIESYPIFWILGAIFLIAFGVVYFFVKKLKIFKLLENENISFLGRLKFGSLFLILPIIAFFTLDKQSFSKVSSNQYNNELAKDGIYSIFSAFRHNELDYDEFYKTLPINEVKTTLFKLTNLDPKTFKKQIMTKKKEKKYNVILVMVESLSAKYMGIYGNKKNLTPNLDKLAKNSLFFKNLYATGTRTVRGMEAVNLSLPPTPGRSIVKRPDCHSLFNAGYIFKKKGYENKFIYAGFGYFDNMNDFFEGNGFEIVDRANFKKDEITFSNVWGVCDEDLLNKTLKEADKSYKNNKKFFFFVMTTSNHRPYTYPEGKIDIPSHTGRNGAVKYTDFAIGEFIKKAQKKSWFKDTIFVIIADHNGGSAGKSSLPVHRYLIPLIIYNPKIIKAQTITKLSSQIDTIPTLLSLMNWSYESQFFGKNILDPNFQERALIGTYQKLGYFKDKKLTILLPNKSVKEFRVTKQSLNDSSYKEIKPLQKDLKEAISYYQGASFIYKNRLNRIKGQIDKDNK